MLTGAKAALEGTPGLPHNHKVIEFYLNDAGMIGYGLAKAAVHQLVQSLAKSGSGLPPDAGVVGILP